MLNSKLGTLYVVATPIGNLKDITFRAIEILKQVDKILAEDTRHTYVLLKNFSIQKPTLALHDFNERETLQKLISYLQQGESLALVSDAGTPLISDPGFSLVKEVRACGINVIPIPGACAAIAALSVAGLPTDKFIFEGFLPAKSEACRQRLQALKSETRTIVLYEAPHRFISLLENLLDILGGNRMVCVARELTKIHESIMTDHLSSLVKHFKSDQAEKRGEFVILVAGAEEAKPVSSFIKQTLQILLAELPLKQAVKLAEQITGERKNSLYKLALQLTDQK